IEFRDAASNLLVLVHDDGHQRPVAANRLLDRGQDRLVLEAQLGHQLLCQEPYGIVEDDFIPLASLARRHHLVQRGLEFGEFVDEIFVHPDQRSERIVRRLVHRPRLPSVGLKACASRREPCRRPRKGYGVANVLELADPLDKPLHPMPKPACGTLPYRRVSRYQSYAFGSSPCSLRPFRIVSRSVSRSLPPTISPTPSPPITSNSRTRSGSFGSRAL